VVGRRGLTSRVRSRRVPRALDSRGIHARRARAGGRAPSVGVVGGDGRRAESRAASRSRLACLRRVDAAPAGAFARGAPGQKSARGAGLRLRRAREGDDAPELLRRRSRSARVHRRPEHPEAGPALPRYRYPDRRSGAAASGRSRRHRHPGLELCRGDRRTAQRVPRRSRPAPAGAAGLATAMTLRALVTGAGGFLGSHLTRELVAQGDEVHVLLRAPDAAWRLADVQSRLGVCRGDLFDGASLRAAIATARPDVLFHLARDTPGRPDEDHGPRPLFATTVVGTFHRLTAAVAACRTRPLIVRTGTLLEYGNAPAPFHEATPEVPSSSYAATQLTAT